MEHMEVSLDYLPINYPTSRLIPPIPRIESCAILTQRKTIDRFAGFPVGKWHSYGRVSCGLSCSRTNRESGKNDNLWFGQPNIKLNFKLSSFFSQFWLNWRENGNACLDGTERNGRTVKGEREVEALKQIQTIRQTWAYRLTLLKVELALKEKVITETSGERATKVIPGWVCVCVDNDLFK